LTTEAPERIEVEAEHLRDRFSRAVAVAIVLVTLLAAVAHFLQSANEEKASDAALNAQKLAIVGNGQQAAVLQDAGAQFGLLALSEEQRTRQANGLQAQLNEIATSVINDKDTTLLTQEQERWKQLASASENLTEIKADGPAGPQQDASFPSRYLNDKLTELDKLRAERDAVNEESQSWNSKVTAYAAVLTLTAVALYLLGLSIALKVRIRLGLAGLGATLALIAVVVSIFIQATPPQQPPPQAADEYAEGLKELHNAAANSDLDGFKSSAEHLRQATTLRPKFGLAYEKLAEAELGAGAPAPTAIGVVASDDAVRRAEAALKKALQLGNSSRSVLVDYGAVEYQLWLRDGQKSRLEDAVKYQRKAQGLDTADPIPSENLAVGLIALGQDSDARAAARDAMVRLFKLNNAVFTEFGVGDTMTSLETLLKAKPDTAGRVQAMKEYLTSAAANQTPDPTGGDSRSANDVQINVNAGSLDWSAKVPGFRQKDDHVSVQWYYRDPDKVAWTALPAASGSYTELPTVNFRGADGYGQRNPFLSASGQCLQDGSYRVEIYINGKLAGSTEKDFTLGSMKGHRLLDVGAAACLPGDWTTTSKSVRGFENGFVSPKGDAGLLVFRYQDVAVGGSADPHANSSKYLALTMAAFKDQFPSPPQFEQTPSGQSFLTLAGTSVQFFSFPGGRVQAGAGVSTVDGSVLVGIVYGPPSSFTSLTSTSAVVYNSLVETY
jgi:tetratricopeptide (TPR) repeat protein